VPRMPHMPRGEAKVSGSGQGKPSASLIYGSRGCRFESCRARAVFIGLITLSPAVFG
jgi:hypothetical protein